MSRNIVVLRGNLADDPYFQHTPDGAPYLRFFLVVEREGGGLSRHQGAEPQRADLLRVIKFGQHAELDYFYLRKGAAVVVFGRLQSRAYKDLRSGVVIKRNQLEVTAQFIVYGRSCDMERGDRHRDDMAEHGGESAEVVAGARAEVSLPDHLLKMLSADAE